MRGELTVGVWALDVSSGSPVTLLRLEELLLGLWLLGEAVRRDTNDTDGSQTDKRQNKKTNAHMNTEKKT